MRMVVGGVLVMMMTKFPKRLMQTTDEKHMRIKSMRFVEIGDKKVKKVKKVKK
jgi:hypothetical protein